MEVESLVFRLEAGDDEGESVWTRLMTAVMTAERAELRTGKPHFLLGGKQFVRMWTERDSVGFQADVRECFDRWAHHFAMWQKLLFELK